MKDNNNHMESLIRAEDIHAEQNDQSIINESHDDSSTHDSQKLVDDSQLYEIEDAQDVEIDDDTNDDTTPKHKKRKKTGIEDAQDDEKDDDTNDDTPPKHKKRKKTGNIKREGPVYHAYPIDGMKNEGSIFDAKNRNPPRYLINHDSGYGFSALQVGLGVVCHCVYCILKGEKPTNYTLKSMDTHLHGNKRTPRCKHITGYMERPKLLLNIANLHKSIDTTEPTISLKNALYECRGWVQAHLNYDEDEISLILPFCTDRIAHANGFTFPVLETSWRAAYASWGTQIRRDHSPPIGGSYPDIEIVNERLLDEPTCPLRTLLLEIAEDQNLAIRHRFEILFKVTYRETIEELKFQDMDLEVYIQSWLCRTKLSIPCAKQQFNAHVHMIATMSIDDLLLMVKGEEPGETDETPGEKQTRVRPSRTCHVNTYKGQA